MEGLGLEERESANGEGGRLKAVKGVVQEVEERGQMMVKAFEPLRVAYQNEMGTGRGMYPGNCNYLRLPFMKLPNQIHQFSTDQNFTEKIQCRARMKDSRGGIRVYIYRHSWHGFLL